MRDIVEALTGPLARVRDRVSGAVKVHYENVRLAGQRTQPVVVLEGVWAENTAGQNHFISDFEVELLRPVKTRSVRSEWRQHKRPVAVSKGANLPAFGRTDGAWDVMLWLGDPLEVAEGEFKGYVKGVGRKGFRAVRTAVSGRFEIADE